MTRHFVHAARSLGVFLLLAALLKALSLLFDPASGVLSTRPLWLTLVAIQLELILGSMLVCMPRSRRILILNAMLFLAFALAAFAMALNGAHDCGCLGRIAVHPLFMCCVDVGAAAFLAWASFGAGPKTVAVDDVASFGGMQRGRSCACRVGIGFLMGLISLGLCGVCLALVSEDFRDWGAALVRPDVEVVPRVVDFGTAKLGDERYLGLSIVNHSDQPITLLGGRASCSCVTLPRFPIHVDAKGRSTVAIRVHFDRGRLGRFGQKVLLYCNHRRQFALVAGVTGRVQASEEGSGALRLRSLGLSVGRLSCFS